MDTETSFGAWLRQRRRVLDLTQDQLAARVGCSGATIRKIEADERRPSKQLAELLAHHLKIPAEERGEYLRVARGERRPEYLPSLQATVEQSASMARVHSLPAPIMVPPASQPLAATHLPVPPTLLIGRDSELADLNHLLAQPECRLLTLIGAGGVGKTRLALAAAEAQRPVFANGVYFVSLAPLMAPEFIVTAIANTLDFAFTRLIPPRLQLLDYLRTKTMFLVLDNIEHLLSPPPSPAAAQMNAGSASPVFAAMNSQEDGASDTVESIALLEEILEAGPAIKLLVTSRERLGIQAEWVYDLQGLASPPATRRATPTVLGGEPAGAEATPESALERYGAVALFVANARRARAGFVLAPNNLPAVIRICRLLDGMPLGIELAAAWVHMLSCEEIAAEIEQNIDFLSVTRRNAPDRHRSLRAAFDYSWKLLTPAEQQALSQLALFRGGFVREAAQVVAEAPLPVLSSLIAKSLVRRLDDKRYDLHELTRQFAVSHLHEDEKVVQAAQERHSRYFLAMLASHKAALKASTQEEVLALLDPELDNIQLAWNWAVTNAQVERVGQAADGLGLFSLWRGRYQQGEAAFQLAVEHLSTGASGEAHRLPVLVQLLTWQANFCRHLGKIACAGELLQQGLTLLDALAGQETTSLRAPLLLELGRLTDETDRPQAIHLVRQSLQSYEMLGDQHGMASAYFELGEIARRLGNLEEARHMALTSLRLHEKLQDARGVADALLVLNYITMDQGDHSEAERLVRQRVALYGQLGDRAGLANAYRILGHLLSNRGEYIEGMRWFDESLAIYSDLGDRREMAIGLAYQGIPRVALGQYAEAKARGEEALRLAQENHSPFGLAIVQVLFGTVALATARYAEACQYFQASVDIFQQLGERNLAGQALAWLGYAELGMGNPERAQRVLNQAIQIASALQVRYTIMVSLPALVLLMAALGKLVRASELYALAMRYPIIATAQFVTDVVGKQMALIAASLPPEILTAAEERGRSLDLATTVAELIAEFRANPG